MLLAGVELWIWGAFVAFLLLVLGFDLLVLHRHAHVISMREAATWSTVWIALGLSFGGIVWWWRGADAAGQYLAGYLIEKSLSVDNVFVFALLFSYFAVPAAYQHRVLFWGVLGAIVLRGAFIALGAAMLERFHWTIYLFGGLLILTGLRMLFHKGAEINPERNPALRLTRRVVPMTERYEGQHLFTRVGGQWKATPLFAVLVTVETTDLIFAVDSIPAIFAITSDPFLVFTSNAFAILGLRALYFLLAGMMGRFAYLKIGLGVILVGVGLKMLASDLYEVPIWLSLGAIALILTASILPSLLFRQDSAGQPGAPAQ